MLRRSASFLPLVLPVLLACFTPHSHAQTLTVTAPSSFTIHPGDQNVTLPVTIGASSLAGPVSVTLRGLPSGITVAPLTLTPGSSGNLVVSATVFADHEQFPTTTIGGPNSATTTVTVVAAAGTTQATANTALTVSLSNPDFAPAPDKINLPIVRIDTGGVPVTSKDIDVPGTITITSVDGSTSYLPNASDSDNTATFHVHGTTASVMQKKPYNIKLHTSLDLLSTMGLYCPYNRDPSQSTCDKSKSYILLANYDDKSLLRDWSATSLLTYLDSADTTLNVISQNGFSGPIRLACTAGLPAGGSCIFSPSTVTAAPGINATSALHITLGSTATAHNSSLPAIASKTAAAFAFALLLWPARSRSRRLLAVLLLVVAAGGTLIGCGSNNNANNPTPTTYSITVQATGGSVSQSTVLQVSFIR